ncbi:DUF4381 domain-containing protein [Paraferrimonas sedimenticola]|uniref:DUF4381 domain-containing protein n=1 Tax=Paraferrimonas sedimenticola TaxID=375674 RepID=A0AA37W181_9GAMM|nr:DUF4381 domain-containing protein [Paraferrimonas sedimenticola]GLP96598.1 hypothetical protein GCM10007895_19040 [Paraferrimonas sedimenticola]
MDPLANMADIVEPTPVSFWLTLHPLWYLLVLLVLASAGLALWWWRQRRQYRAAQQQAIQELALMTQAHQVIELNALLKRVARHYHPSSQAWGKTTADWCAWLQSIHPAPIPLEPILSASYSPQGVTQKDFEQMRAWAQQWLKQALPARRPHA